MSIEKLLAEYRRLTGEFDATIASALSLLRQGAVQRHKIGGVLTELKRVVESQGGKWTKFLKEQKINPTTDWAARGLYAAVPDPATLEGYGITEALEATGLLKPRKPPVPPADANITESDTSTNVATPTNNTNTNVATPTNNNASPNLAPVQEDSPPPVYSPLQRIVGALRTIRGSGDPDPPEG